MTNNKNSDRYLILLENIQSQVQFLAEGQTQLRSDLMAEIIARHESLEGKIQILHLAVNRNARSIQDNTRGILDNKHAIEGIHKRLDCMTDKFANYDREIHELKTH
jgi:hypothetical protein